MARQISIRSNMTRGMCSLTLLGSLAAGMASTLPAHAAIPPLGTHHITPSGRGWPGPLPSGRVTPFGRICSGGFGCDPVGSGAVTP